MCTCKNLSTSNVCTVQPVNPQHEQILKQLCMPLKHTANRTSEHSTIIEFRFILKNNVPFFFFQLDIFVKNMELFYSNYKQLSITRQDCSSSKFSLQFR